MPEGIRWNLTSSSPRTIVWPALLPPWKRTIASAGSASRSTTLPLPSSPHWAPTMTIPGIAGGLCLVLGPDRARLLAPVGAEERQRVVADLDQARDRARADLLLELPPHPLDVALGVAGDEHRALVLVARVDQRGELLDHPVGVALGAEVVDVEQVDRGQPPDEGVVGVLGFGR